VLSNAGVMCDDFNKPSGELYGSGEKKGKDGVDIGFPAGVTWFVCRYGDGRSVAWWEELKLDQVKVKGCTMQIREDHRIRRPSGWSASDSLMNLALRNAVVSGCRPALHNPFRINRKRYSARQSNIRCWGLVLNVGS
jgi:hypothetical protein